MDRLAFPPPLLTDLTTDDMIRSGACRSEVMAVRSEKWPTATLVSVDDLLSSAEHGHDTYLKAAAGLAGSGSGLCGYGSGDGLCGSGDGDWYWAVRNSQGRGSWNVTGSGTPERVYGTW